MEYNRLRQGINYMIDKIDLDDLKAEVTAGFKG
jgi:hypothetical protein